VYVGKVAGHHALPQSEINALLVSLATRGGGARIVVRLKGGDPYLFGRGGEEALACAKAGVSCEVVPGVTSGIAAPASVGVPVTHREFTRGVVFLTGHMSGNGELDLPWRSLADCGLTLVFFMAVSTAERIAQQLMAAGMNASMPVMVVQEGSTLRQRSVSTKLLALGETVRREGIGAPAIVVIGKVASLAETIARAASGATARDARGQEIAPEESVQRVDRYSIASCSHPHA